MLRAYFHSLEIPKKSRLFCRIRKASQETQNEMVLRVRDRTMDKEGIFNHVLGETLKRKKTQLEFLT